MATMALPIRELSASARYQAARAEKTFWEVVESKARAARIELWVKVKIYSLDRSMGGLIEKQDTLLAMLRNFGADDMPQQVLGMVAGDLELLTAMTDAFIEATQGAPQQCLDVWGTKLEKIAERSAYIDNYAESFRIASDEACTAILADAVRSFSRDVISTR